MPYTYTRSTEGTDETFDVIQPDGEHLVSVHFWDDSGGAEVKAKLITRALNYYASTGT